MILGVDEMEESSERPGQGPNEPVTEPVSALERYEQALAGAAAPVFLVLYVAGAAPASLRAIRFARRLCDEHLPEDCRLDVVDIYQQPELADLAGVLAVPTLIKTAPPPEMKFIGDLSNLDRVLRGLGVAPRAQGEQR